MSKFIFLENLETFIKDNLLLEIRESRLQSVNDAYKHIVEFLEDIVDLVHLEGGCTVY